MRWPWIDDPVGAYSLSRDGIVWRLDGILCQGGLNFNFTLMDKIKGLTVKPRDAAEAE